MSSERKFGVLAMIHPAAHVAWSSEKPGWHDTEDAAYDEAKRAAEANPWGRFAVIEVVKWVEGPNDGEADARHREAFGLANPSLGPPDDEDDDDDFRADMDDGEQDDT